MLAQRRSVESVEFATSGIACQTKKRREEQSNAISLIRKWQNPMEQTYCSMSLSRRNLASAGLVGGALRSVRSSAGDPSPSVATW